MLALFARAQLANCSVCTMRHCFSTALGPQQPPLPLGLGMALGLGRNRFIA